MTPIPILVYHSVCADASSAYQRFTVTPDELDAQLGALAPLGCTPVPLAAVTRAAYALPSRPVVVTFDDGLADFESALPILRRHDVPSTLFVVAARVGGVADWRGH